MNTKTTMNRNELFKAIIGRKLLVWANLGGQMVMIETSPSKIMSALLNSPSTEFMVVEVRDTGLFLEIRMDEVQ